MVDVRFVKGGKLVDRAEAAASAVLVAGAGLSDPSTVHAFSDERTFRAWIVGSPAKKRVADLDDVVTRTRRECDGAEVTAGRQRENADRAAAALFGAGERLGAQPAAEECLRKVTSDGVGAKAHFSALMVLFDAYDLGGGWRPVAGTVAELGWLDFDDRTSSLWLAGAGMLAQDPWFGGQRLYVLGAPFTRIDSLRAFGFDNRASSAAVL